jgi:acetylornithine deacetylase/succinyl-diaminopimelate desuccinylase-like protein
VRYVANDGTVMDRAPEKLGYAPVKLRSDVMQPLEKLAAEIWPGAPVIPTMSTGASDGVYTNAAGLPTFGISGTAIDMDDVRAHGKDERLGVQSYYNGVEFYYRFLKALTGGK